MTAAAITQRTEAQLIRALADQVRRRRGFEESLHEVMHGESHDRWVNLVAALGMDLHTEPINSYDVDSSLAHPACYAERLRVWAARIGDPAVVAGSLDALADHEERELTAPMSRARVGGRAYLALAGGAL